MITPKDLRGILAMMPGFATDDANSITATKTVAADRLLVGVTKLVNEGIDVLAACGSFGEGYALQRDELGDITRAVVEATRQRIPAFIGCLGLNSREIVARARIAQDAGAQGLLIGLPCYFPQEIENAIRFYEEVAAMFPSLAILIYHNPLLFRTALPLAAFERIAAIPNVVGMKDSHRDTRAFLELMKIVKGRMSVFVGTWQYFPYSDIGAAGFWSYHCWMGPWPVLRLRDAVRAGNRELAQAIMFQISSAYEGPEPPNVRWRETAAKIAIRHAGYVDPGPLRHPFVTVPAEVDQNARKFAERWKELCQQHQPAMSAA
jgi:dihydrodipicolinate synthase/N-acetylneuraminate lyase